MKKGMNFEYVMMEKLCKKIELATELLIAKFILGNSMVYEDFKKSLQKIYINNYKGESIVFCGCFIDIDVKMSYISKLNISSELEFILCEENSSWLNREYNFDGEFKTVILANNFVDYVKKRNYEKELVGSRFSVFLYFIHKKYKKEIEDIQKYDINITERTAITLVFFYERFFEILIKNSCSKQYVFWCENTPIHRIFIKISKKRKVDTNIIELGPIPGTLIIYKNKKELIDNVAKRQVEKFSPTELYYAKEIIKKIKENEINRKNQKFNNNEFELLKKQIEKNVPVVLFLGQIDMASDFSDETGSPIFKSSFEAAKHIEYIAQKNNWIYVYKQHPFYFDKDDKSIQGFSDSTIIAAKVNIMKLIDLSTVIVTISSNGAYDSLFRNKPVVQLGISLLTGSNCVYQIHNIQEIEQTLQYAIIHGYSRIQRESFIVHIASLKKYILFDDDRQSDFVCGKKISEAVSYIENN